MSPDTIFAAQMWTWPDAVIKRNAQGQVLLVNSAFLAMYGGAVEDWAGNLVTGWSNPPAPNTAIRFETRLPGPVDANGYHAGELVFDWIECGAPDGTSLSIARNITHVMPGPGVPESVPSAPVEAAPVFEAVEEPTPAPAFEPVMEQAAAQAAPINAAPIQPDAPASHVADATPAAFIPTADTLAQAAPAPVMDTHVADAPIVEAPVVEGPAVHAPVEQSFVEQAPVLETTVVEAPAVEAPVAEGMTVQEAPADISTDTGEREFERRALPIEDGSAVLGNNWRDAVIAKAVGATGAEAPAAPEAHDSAPELPGTTAPTIRILLAEDNAINALLTRTLLEAEGCIVDTVEDGALAVEAMKVQTYDLIFMDMRMPNMDGLESTRKIRSMDHRSKGLPIIALTANAFDDDRNACFDSGMNDFMTKPVSAEELSEMVAAWTGEGAKEKLARMA